ncbi:MAG: hypothetical protein BGO14_01475 [Chlamydiales bacterium 38-26]|nr:BlaI/MecI/CopY family transcriptional regulator [Chlamydiales bacterium]OJV08117.1 MAG: hypothetical protein BGO14_01475 [Chlamydiales bacterium 38-26]
MSKRNFGELESEILQAFKSNQRMTVKEIYRILGEDKNKYNTIMTVMLRLSQKKILNRERVGLQYEYWLSDPTSKVPSFFEQIKKKFFGLKTSQMVSYLIDSADDISEEDLEEMEKMLERARTNKKTVKPSC